MQCTSAFNANKTSKRDWAPLIFGLIFFVANLITATFSPLTHDEASTYLHGVMQGIRPLLLFTFNDANNHILNSAMMIISTRLIGHSEIALRLPNIFANLLYLYCALWITKRYKTSWSGMLILIAPLPINTYFALARGYGLANSLTALAIVCLIKGFDTRSIHMVLFSMLAALLAVAANYSYLVVYSCITAVCGCYMVYMKRRKRNLAKFNKAYSVTALAAHIVFGLYLLYPLFKLLQRDAFYIGGTQGFVRDTVMSLLEGLTGCISLHISHLISIIVLSVIFVVCCVDALKTANEGDITPIMLLVLLVGSFCVTLILHHCFNSNYPTGRTALYYYILFGAVFLTSKMLRYLRFVLAILFLVVFVICYRPYGAGIERDTKDALRVLIADANTRGENIRLAIDWIFEPAMRYYQLRYEAPYEFIVDRTGYPGNRDYYLEHKSWYDPHQTRILRTNYNYAYIHKENSRRLNQNYNLTILEEYPLSGNVLLRLEPIY